MDRVEVAISVEYSTRRRRSLSLSIRANAQVTATVPSGSRIDHIIDFLSENTRFLKKALTLPTRHVVPAIITTGNTLYLFGRQYLVEVTESTRTSLTVYAEHQTISIKSPKARILRRKFYLQLAKHFRDQLLNTTKNWYGRMYTSFDRPVLSNVRVRYATSRWGSCTTKGNVMLNTRLLHYPQSAIDYVMIHELAHLTQHNHSQRFWAVVKEFCPGYKEQKVLLHSGKFG